MAISHHEGGRAQFCTGEEKVVRHKSKIEAENVRTGERGRGKKGRRKIKNASRAEAGRKPPVGLSAGKLTSNRL